MLSTNQKGGIAETKITAAAYKLDIPVLRPVVEHERYDLAFEIGDRIYRVQCKWGGLDKRGAVIKVSLQSNYLTPQAMCASPTRPMRSILWPSTAASWTVVTFFRAPWLAGEGRSRCD